MCECTSACVYVCVCECTNACVGVGVGVNNAYVVHTKDVCIIIFMSIYVCYTFCSGQAAHYGSECDCI